MLSNMACSLIEHKKINTTVAKAKALQKYVEPLITKSKTDTTHSRRVVFSYLKQKEAVTELFREVATKVADRPGGYTRILKTGFRIGDNAEMCFIELVDYNENMLTDTKKKSSSRRRRGGAKSKRSEDSVLDTETKATTDAKPTTDTVEEKAKVDEPKAEEVKVEEPKAEEPKAEKTTESPEAKAEEAPEEKTENTDENEEEKKD